MTDQQVAAAVADLAERLQLGTAGAAAIGVISDEPVTWSDSSAGCPQPGQMYAQVLTPGRQIMLEHNGSRFDYHAAGDRPPFLCEQSGPPSRRHFGRPAV